MKSLSSPTSPEPAPKPQGHGKVTALHDFTGQVDSDLTFSAGQVIEVTEKLNEEWLKGRLDGKEGEFPIAFVDMSGYIE